MWKYSSATAWARHWVVGVEVDTHTQTQREVYYNVMHLVTDSVSHLGPVHLC